MQLKLSLDNIHYLNSLLSNIGQIDIKDFNREKTDRKVVLSILIGVADEVAKMYKKLKRKTDLFNNKKKHSITLTFHQAYAVWVCLSGALNNDHDTHRNLMAYQIHIQLDPIMQ